MTYSALEIAKFVISKCIDSGKPVDNLKLQKILYFIWTDYYRSKRTYLFNDRFEAWKYGPVVPSVYYEYRTYIAQPIDCKDSYKIDSADEELLSGFVDKYNKKSVGDLIRDTHESGSPWSDAFGERGMSAIISFDKIIDSLR